MSGKFEKIIRDIPCPGWYPPWATISTATLFFGVGKDQIKQWCNDGVVLRRSKGKTSVQVRCLDIDRVMNCEAIGVQADRALPMEYKVVKRKMRRTVKS